MVSPNHTAVAVAAQQPPVVNELAAIFKELPDEDLLARLKGPRRRGRPGYDPVILWRCYVAYYYLGLNSVSDLIRLLHDNPFVAQACGLATPDDIPSQPTFSRFGTKLAKHTGEFILAIKNVHRDLTRKLYETLPDFGKVVAIDSTDVKGWSNAIKRGKKGASGVRRQKPRVGKVSDPDCGWCVKKNTEGTKKYVFGYKIHILADAKYELPMVVDISPGNMHDIRKASPLLRQARFVTGKFVPDYVLADAGYSSLPLWRLIKNQYRAEPIIDPNPTHKIIVARNEKTPEWKKIYSQRTSIERLNGRLKGFRKLNSVRVRGRFKVRIHAMMSIIVCQAQALATGTRNSVRKVA